MGKLASTLIFSHHSGCHLQFGDSSLTVGAAVSLSNLIGLLRDNQSKSSSSFEQLANHLSRIANVPVRNVGTWAGNLMLTHDNDNFPSDVFTMMAGVDAKVNIGKSPLNPEVSLPHSYVRPCVN